jgi:hypothetical protein
MAHADTHLSHLVTRDEPGFASVSALGLAIGLPDLPRQLRRHRVRREIPPVEVIEQIADQLTRAGTLDVMVALALDAGADIPDAATGPAHDAARLLAKAPARDQPEVLAILARVVALAARNGPPANR